MVRTRVLLALWSLLLLAAVDARLPHIVFMVADDLGYHDVGFHGGEIPTPNLDALAAESVQLKNYHVYHFCTPFRSALLTGRYPIRYGLQNEVIRPAEPNGLPLNETLLPEVLNAYGYRSHIVGKWHIGHYTWEHTPTYRGFESHYGFYLSDGDFYTHSRYSTFNYYELFGYDFRRNVDVAWDDRGQYSGDLYNREVERIIAAHNPDEPLFLYMAFQNPHFPLQVPTSYVLKTACNSVPNRERRIYCGMVNALDNSVGKIVANLKEYGLWDDTLLIFSSDNGGTQEFGGNNSPYRGEKATNFEGGVRGIGLVHGKMVGRIGESHDLTHATDWFPTLENLVKALAEEQPAPPSKPRFPLDGIDIWNHITLDDPIGTRTLLLNSDPISGGKALIAGNYKYMVEVNQPYFVIPGENETYAYVPMPAGLPTGNYSDSGLYLYEWIFNLDTDPLEANNLAFTSPVLLDQLRSIMAQYDKEAVKPGKKPETLAADPANFEDVWTPWVNATKSRNEKAPSTFRKRMELQL